MSQSNQSASSNPADEDNRTGPFAVEPKYDCPHLANRAYIFLQPNQEGSNEGQPPCTTCAKTRENWVCLEENCEYIGCSRYQGKHMLTHHQTTGHNICLSFSDNSVFCYACDSYIDSPQLHILAQQLSRKAR